MNDKTLLAELTAKVAASYLSNHEISANQLPKLLVDIHETFAGLMSEPENNAQSGKSPAVSISKSLGDDQLVCLEDGMKFQSLKRHLRTHHGLSPAQYREKWGLPSDYPMVAPNYSKKRSRLARASGLGRANEN